MKMTEKIYAKKSEIAELFSIAPHTLDNILTEVRRNPDFENIILKWGVKSVRINISGFEDFLRWKSENRLKSL
ncbi:Excisionase [Lactococcus garvieae]|nr:Excisionase [Lactococcus garvieae]